RSHARHRGWPFLRSLILDRTQASTVPRPRRSSVRDLPCQNLCGIEKGGIARRCTTVTVEERRGRSLSACRRRRKGPGLRPPPPSDSTVLVLSTDPPQVTPQIPCPLCRIGRLVLVETLPANRSHSP